MVAVDMAHERAASARRRRARYEAAIDRPALRAALGDFEPGHPSISAQKKVHVLTRACVDCDDDFEQTRTTGRPRTRCKRCREVWLETRGGHP